MQGFIYEEATFDEQNPPRFHWNGEAIAPGSQRDGAFGTVVKNRPGKPVWARIVAPGYVPQPITEKPIELADDTVLDKFEVRMQRGKTLAGRVVDAEGKPVAAAGVYLLRNQGRRQVVRDPAVTAPNQQFEMLAITHATTDADGRFKMSGWDSESARVAVLSGEMNLWVTSIPDDPSDWSIHLPHPATINCLVDDDPGERDSLYDLDFMNTGRKGWELLRAYQFNLRSKDGRLIAANHTPGQYELTRRRRVAVGDYEGEFRLADVKLQVDPTATFTIDLRHPVGWPIAGKVVGLKELSLSGAVISVEPPGEVKRGAMTFDAVTCGEDGRFETGRIPPGKYRVHVDTYLPKKPADPHVFSGGRDLPPSARLPDFTADADVTIAKDEQPARLKLELKKGGESRAFRELMQYHEQPHPATIDEFTAPPSAVAMANETPAEKPKPAETPKPNDSPMTESKHVEVHGQVVDDATGKPITLFDEQGGHVDPNDPNKIIWGYYLKPNSGGQ
ncbi:MAG TPA: carboxypeptidase-like regulatory domain-containing protein, partial [Pirellulales bacterium]